ncbi:MAG: hypothetical protein DRN71_04745 [Candidatus Nanohalarchaeota archaeon]|nr:MAG: hypothetical protein DRN71_04745 [Candidatus Nanohaloarchaeota archaeon]
MPGLSKDVLGRKENTEVGNVNDVVSMQIADIRKKMDDQVEEMKELSKATMSVVDKVKKLKIDEVSEHLTRIDARLEVLEEHMAVIDKKTDDIDSVAKKDDALPHDIGSDKENPMKLPMEKEESHADKKISNIIETTIDDKNADDCVSETIKQYDNEKSTVQEPGKGNIFTKLMGKVLPGKKKSVAPQHPENVSSAPVSVAPGLSKKEMPLMNIDKPLPGAVYEPAKIAAAPREDAVDKLTMLEGSVESSAVPMNHEAAPLENPVVDLLAVDKKDLRAKMEELIASANQMAVERRYSDATEVYLKLSDAYEKNKDVPEVQVLGVRINELYDKISSNLLNNLMTTDNKEQKMPVLGESKTV